MPNWLKTLAKWSAISVLLLLEVLGAALAWLPLNLATWAKDTRRKLQKGSGDG
jgi:hypothetical protein